MYLGVGLFIHHHYRTRTIAYTLTWFPVTAVSTDWRVQPIQRHTARTTVSLNQTSSHPAPPFLGLALSSAARAPQCVHYAAIHQQHEEAGARRHGTSDPPALSARLIPPRPPLAGAREVPASCARRQHISPPSRISAASDPHCLRTKPS